jgi:hypothetical protein
MKKSVFLAFLVVTATVLFAPAEVLAVTEEANQNAATPEMSPESILSRASEFLGALPGFSVTIRCSYDTIQTDGQRVEFGELRNILIQRPNRMSAEVLRSDGDLDLLLFDGQALTAYKTTDNVYARVEHTGTVDSAIVYLVKDLQIRFPLARLLLTSLPELIKKQVESVSFVEVNQLYEVPVDQLAVRTADVDFQLWVDQGDKPLPRRIVITYKNDPGQPQFRADFFDWNLAPEITADSFTLTPADGAEEILFLAPIRSDALPAIQEGGKP